MEGIFYGDDFHTRGNGVYYGAARTWVFVVQRFIWVEAELININGYEYMIARWKIKEECRLVFNEQDFPFWRDSYPATFTSSTSILDVLEQFQLQANVLPYTIMSGTFDLLSCLLDLTDANSEHEEIELESGHQYDPGGEVDYEDLLPQELAEAALAETVADAMGFMEILEYF